MKLQQLRYIVEVLNHNLNVSSTAESLFTSQPGISKQMRMLEDELGVQIFARSGKHLTEVTAAGKQIIAIANHILTQVDAIKAVAANYNQPDQGHLSIATTHTQARYALPSVITAFQQRYPKVTLHMQQILPEHRGETAANGGADIVIANANEALLHGHHDLIMLPCYYYGRSIIVPQQHPLATLAEVTMSDLGDYPIVSYRHGFSARAALDAAFHSAGIKANVVFAATDADVIKAYVKMGLGVGVIATMAYDPVTDADLVAIPAQHLFMPGMITIGLRKGTFLRSYMYDFIAALAPHLSSDLLAQAMSCGSQQQVDALFESIDLPQR
jgi:LysR family cys regulon transcriptional activator